MLPNKILPKVEYSWYCESRCKVNLTHLSPHGASSWRLAWCSCQEGSCRTYQSSNYQLMTWLPKLGPRKIKVTKSHELWQMQSTIYICICTYTNRYDCRDDPKCPPRLSCVLPSWCIFISLRCWFMASVMGPVSCIPWSSAQDNTLDTTPLKATTVTKERVVFCWYLLI